MNTVAELLLARADDDHPGLLFEDREWTWAEVVAESKARAAMAQELRTDGAPFHIGVLLENGPEYVFWLGGAALAGATLVGINPTRRGAELKRDVEHTDCAAVVTDDAGAALLEAAGVETPLVAPANSPGSSPYSAVRVASSSEPDTLLLLLFTSGSTGAPKAVRCTQARLAAIGKRAADVYGFRREDVCYCPMPMFHGNAVMAVWAPALVVGATFATRPKFSASNFLPDVRRFNATFFNYVGKTLAYVLATPEQNDDADNTLQRGFGTEASERDIAAFERRFGCTIVEGYGMSEGGAVIRRTDDTPDGALGLAPSDATVVVDPDTRQECARARFDSRGQLLNADEAIGEIVNKDGAAGFEGYYNNAEADAERLRDGWYWTGDLGYRDEAGFFYFAGRSGDWLRVDGENFAAAPIERILFRHPGVVMAAVYSTPDPRGGDQVMAALELRANKQFDGDAFAAWLAAQPDLGTKWAPRFVRITEDMPLTGTNKVRKHPLRVDGWECDDAVWWRADRDDPGYRQLTDEDRAALHAERAAHGGGTPRPAATAGSRPRG